MNIGEINDNRDEFLRSVLTVQLSKADIALVIGALLQAAWTQPLLDPRYLNMRSVHLLYARQVALADKLEDLMAGEVTASPGE